MSNLTLVQSRYSFMLNIITCAKAMLSQSGSKLDPAVRCCCPTTSGCGIVAFAPPPPLDPQGLCLLAGRGCLIAVKGNSTLSHPTDYLRIWQYFKAAISTYWARPVPASIQTTAPRGATVSTITPHGSVDSSAWELDHQSWCVDGKMRRQCSAAHRSSIVCSAKLIQACPNL